MIIEFLFNQEGKRIRTQKSIFKKNNTKKVISFFLFLSLIVLYIITNENFKIRGVKEFISKKEKNYYRNIIYKSKYDLKVALCTMGKKENLYIKEYVEYYKKLGVDHIFLYDDNEPGTEKFSDVINRNYQDIVSIYNAKSFIINNQSMAFTDCYNNNKNKYDWFLMFDMDEFLYIVNDTLKGYLSNNIFNKCDFIKLHWVISTDNNLVYYDSRPLFERFKPPYIKSVFIKSIIRGNIPGLKYWVHSPFVSSKRNTTCNNEGNIIYYKNMNFESINPININKAYLIHFRYKSTEELVNKIKRGYGNWFENRLQNYLIGLIREYLNTNNATLEKISFIEKKLNLDLSEYKKKLTKI